MKRPKAAWSARRRRQDQGYKIKINRGEAAARLLTHLRASGARRFVETASKVLHYLDRLRKLQGLLRIIDLRKEAQLDQARHQHEGYGWKCHTLADQSHGLASQRAATASVLGLTTPSARPASLSSLPGCSSKSSHIPSNPNRLLPPAGIPHAPSPPRSLQAALAPTLLCIPYVAVATHPPSLPHRQSSRTAALYDASSFQVNEDVFMFEGKPCKLISTRGERKAFLHAASSSTSSRTIFDDVVKV